MLNFRAIGASNEEISFIGDTTAAIRLFSSVPEAMDFKLFLKFFKCQQCKVLEWYVSGKPFDVAENYDTAVSFRTNSLLKALLKSQVDDTPNVVDGRVESDFLAAGFVKSSAHANRRLLNFHSAILSLAERCLSFR